MPTDTNNEISSAEMTCTWRCNEPLISGDDFSVLLASSQGKQKARVYESEQYKFASRHFSIRAGYFLKYAIRLLETNQFDSIVSLGSGLSLLTHCILAKAPANLSHEQFTCVDSDLPKMMTERMKRLKEQQANLPKLKSYIKEEMALDVEQAYRESVHTSKKLSHFLPESCRNPLFIVEGLTYFLTKPCLDWIFDSLNQYSASYLLLTKRTQALKDHPGQICFPGGEQNKGESLEACALREFHEEVGLEDDVSIITELTKEYTTSHFCVTPFVGLIKTKILSMKPNHDEVEDVILLPLDLTLDPKQFSKLKESPLSIKENQYELVYQDHVIWGITAQILYRIATNQQHIDTVTRNIKL